MKKVEKTKDHTGRTFHSISEMCRFYGIPRTTYTDRMRHGWTQKDALTKHVDRVLGQDHLWMRKRMNCGIEAEIIIYNGKDHVVIKFDDGEMADGTLSNFLKGKIAHPLIRTKGSSTYGCLTVSPKWQEDKDAYFMVICKKCKFRSDLWTADQLVSLHNHLRSNISSDCENCGLKDSCGTAFCRPFCSLIVKNAD